MTTPQMPDPEQREPDATAQPAPPGDEGGPAPLDRGTRRETLKARARLIGAAAIAVLAVLTLAFLGPETSSHGIDRLLIWTDDTANQERAQGAPQQTVVNGWTGNELLSLISEQLEDSARPDHRPAVLLTLGVLLLALTVVTVPSAGAADRRTA